MAWRPESSVLWAIFRQNYSDRLSFEPVQRYACLQCEWNLHGCGLHRCEQCVCSTLSNCQLHGLGDRAGAGRTVLSLSYPAGEVSTDNQETSWVRWFCGLPTSTQSFQVLDKEYLNVGVDPCLKFNLLFLQLLINLCFYVTFIWFFVSHFIIFKNFQWMRNSVKLFSLFNMKIITYITCTSCSNICLRYVHLLFLNFS